MATLTIRNLPDDVRDKLRIRAARNGRSMEAEAREAIAELISSERPRDAGTRAQSVARLGAGRQDGPVSDPASETQSAKLERARAVLRRRVSPDRSLVDEFLRERRALWGEE